jgi:hypothetical protein
MNCADLPRVMVSMAQLRSLSEVLGAITTGLAQCPNVVLAHLAP